MANKAWQIAAPGKLVLSDLGPIPEPRANQVLVRIHAASLNYRDRLVVDHNPSYPTKAKKDLVPGSDGAGVVEAVGPGSVWKKGDRVVVHPNEWTHGFDQREFDVSLVYGGGEVDGTFRSWAVLDDKNLFKAPDVLSLEEAATMFTAGLTAFRALFHGAVKLGPGSTVLTQGTGGLSCYAIMLAAATGATVFATSSSDEKLDVARKLGATHLINYRKNPDWAAKVLELSGGKGVDLVVDVVGATDLEKTLRCTAFAGTVINVGLLGSYDGKATIDMLDVLFGAKTICGHLGAGSRDMAMEMSAFIDKHKLHPAIAQTFEFEEAEKALEALDNLTSPGKIVLKC